MELQIESLPAVKSPLSDAFWEGVAIGIAIGVVVAT